MSVPLELLLTSDQLHARVKQLGAELDEAFEGRTPVLVVVLHGAVPFLADLVRAMSATLEVEAIALTRFDSGGVVSLALSPSMSLKNRHVVIVEDIVDTGLTLRSLRAHLGAQEPKSLSTVALLDKATRRLVEVPVEFSGFTVGDEFVIGFGMDWEGKYRNLPDIWTVLDLERLRSEPDAADNQLWPDGDSVKS